MLRNAWLRLGETWVELAVLAASVVTLPHALLVSLVIDAPKWQQAPRKVRSPDGLAMDSGPAGNGDALVADHYQSKCADGQVRNGGLSQLRVGRRANYPDLLHCRRVCSGAIMPSSPTDFYNLSSIITGNTGSVQTAAAFNARAEAAKTAKG